MPRRVSLVVQGLALTLLLVAATALGAGSASAEGAAPSEAPSEGRPTDASLARFLPRTSLLAVTADDIDAWREALADTGLARLAREPDVAMLLGEIGETLREEIDAIEGQLGLTLADWPQLVSGQIAYAITGIALNQSKPFLPYQVFIAKPQGRAAHAVWSRFEKRLAAALLDKVPGIEDGSTRIAGAHVRTLSKGGITIYAAHYHGHLVVGTDEAAVTDALEAIGSEARAGADDRFREARLASSLAGSRTFQAVHAQALGDRPGALLFLNAEVLLDKVLVKAALPERAKVEALGLDEIEAVGVGLTIDGTSFYDTIYIHAPGAYRGLSIWLESFGPIDPQVALRRVRAEAAFAGAARVRPNVMRRVYVSLLDALGTPEQQAGYRSDVRDLEEALGCSMLELLDAFGGLCVASASLPERGEGIYPEAVFELTPRSIERTRSRLDDVISRLTQGGADVPPLDIRTIPVRRAELGIGDALRYWNLGRLGGASPLESAFATTADSLLVAATPILLKGVLERRAIQGGAIEDAAADWPTSPGAQGALPDAPWFRRATAHLRSPDRLGPDALRALVYLDAPQVVRGLYNTYGPFFQAASDKGELPFEPGLLPTTRTLTRHLSAATLALEHERGATRLSLRSPVGPVALVALGVMSEAIKQARKRAIDRGAPVAEPAAKRFRLGFVDQPLPRALDEVAAATGVAIRFARKPLLAVRVSLAPDRDRTAAEIVAALLDGTGFVHEARALASGRTQIVIFARAVDSESSAEASAEAKAEAPSTAGSADEGASGQARGR